MKKNKITRRDFIVKAGMAGIMATTLSPLSSIEAFAGTGRKEKKTNPSMNSEWDVIVVGGGPAGCAAAISAAREGAKTLLIEATGMLGGMGTAGLLNAWCPFTDGEKIIYNGLAEKIYWEARKGVPTFPEDKINWMPINTEQLKRVYDDFVISSGASVLFFTQLAAVQMAGKDKVDFITVANKDGLSNYKAKIYIDCTGDGDLAAWAGADYVYGDSTNFVQSSSLCFCIANVHHERYQKYESRIQGYSNVSPIHRIVDSGKYPLIIDKHFNVKMAAPSILMFNAGHIPNVNSTNPQELSDAMIKGRQIAEEIHRALVIESPEIFGNSYLMGTGSLLGVRESRRIVCDYTFKLEDWLERRSFEDEIGRNCYYIDVHKKGATRYPRYGKGETHGIPYRCLTPEKLSNVLVAGRCISTDDYAYGSLRVMPVCLITGEAAGMAGAMASHSSNQNVHKVDVQLLRKRLKEEGQNIQ